MAYLEEIEKIFSVGVWSIIVCQSNISIAITPIDSLAVGNTSDLWSSNVCGVWSGRSYVCITARTVLDLA